MWPTCPVASESWDGLKHWASLPAQPCPSSERKHFGVTCWESPSAVHVSTAAHRAGPEKAPPETWGCWANLLLVLPKMHCPKSLSNAAPHREQAVTPWATLSWNLWGHLWCSKVLTWLQAIASSQQPLKCAFFPPLHQYLSGISAEMSVTPLTVALSTVQCVPPRGNLSSGSSPFLPEVKAQGKISLFCWYYQKAQDTNEMWCLFFAS